MKGRIIAIIYSGYDIDSDVGTTYKVPGILPYQYEPTVRENIATEPNI